MREVGVHLADEIDVGLRDRLLQAIDVRAPKPALAGAVHHLDAARVLARERVGDRPGAVGRAIVDDQHAEARVREHAAHEDRQVLALVIGRDDDEDGRWCVHDSERPPASAAAAMMSTGSITGIRNRSCGKNTRPTRIDDAASSNSDVGRSRAAPEPAHARDGKRQDEQIRHDRRQHDIWRSVPHRTVQPERRV